MRLTNSIVKAGAGAVVALSLVTLVAGFAWLSGRRPHAVVEMRARVAEAGGWTPASFTAYAGEPIDLRLTADDMQHGFAIGRMDNPEIVLAPGVTAATTVTFEQPGKYAFYCTRWCGPGHWRMRGTIEVKGRSKDAAVVEQVPLYVQLGLDIDAPHPASATPESRPSVARSAGLGATLPDALRTRDYYQTHTPAQAWQFLRDSQPLESLTDQQIWDVLAFAWQSATTRQALANGKQLYAANCAACHGDTGAGNGAMASLLGNRSSSGFARGTLTPTNFTDAGTMLGASPALLYGKIIRGGMGTGMPYWGPIFTEEQTWAIVDTLWTFQFQYEETP